jgi:hypothetical protein
LATAKKAICIPSSRMKKTITETVSGTPSHMVVLPWKRAPKVIMKAKPRITSDMRQRDQKKRVALRIYLL